MCRHSVSVLVEELCHLVGVLQSVVRQCIKGDIEMIFPLVDVSGMSS